MELFLLFVFLSKLQKFFPACQKKGFFQDEWPRYIYIHIYIYMDIKVFPR